MMHFPDRADGPWMAELREAGLVTPESAERIDAAMGRPESGSLNDFLIAGADAIPADAWLSWLIRVHECHRVGRAVWSETTAAWARGPVPPDGNLPFRRCADGALVVAVLRPDLRDATAGRFAGQRLHWAAASLNEMRELHAAWRANAAAA